VAAIHRLAQRITKKRQAVRLVVEEKGCYEKWEAEVIRAWDEYWACAEEYPTYKIWRDLCGFRWMLWVESAWFSFLKCAGSPFVTT